MFTKSMKGGRMKKLALTLALFALPFVAAAQQQPAKYDAPLQPEKDTMNQRIDVSKMGVTQKMDAQLPLDARFKDENGKDVKLGDYFKDKPVILLMIFYKCEGVCSLELDGLLEAVNGMKDKKAGQDFEIVTVSIHPNETPKLAKEKEKFLLDLYRYKGTEDGWHLLTGQWDEILRVTESAGFRFIYNEKDDTIQHPAVMLIATPQGHISKYFFGANYPALLVLRSLDAAVNGTIQEAEEKPIMLGCFMKDPVTGRITLVVNRLLMVFGIFTVLAVIFWISILAVRNRRTAIYELDTTNTGA